MSVRTGCCRGRECDGELKKSRKREPDCRRAAKRRKEQHKVQFQELQRVRDIGGVENKSADPQIGRGWKIQATDVEKFAFKILVDTGPWEPDNPFHPPGNGLAEGLFQKFSFINTVNSS